MDHDYTAGDHAVREEDIYAQTKYLITLDWLRALGIPEDAHIANIGAGSGIFAQLMGRAGYDVLNVEPDGVAAAMAEQLLGSASVVHSDLFDFDPKLPIDVVVMHDVLEHIEDDQAAVTRVAELLGRGSRPGLFIASVPAWQWLFGFHDRQLGHYRRYSPKSLRTLVQDHFDVLRIRQFGFLGVPAALWYSRIRSQPYPVGSGGFAEHVFNASCALERKTLSPIGSSVLLAARPV